jgi:hypothetical protein
MEKTVQLNAIRINQARLQTKARIKRILLRLLLPLSFELWANRNSATTRTKRMHLTINIVLVSSLHNFAGNNIN